MGILDDIDAAAYDIMAGHVGDGFLPVAKNFNIAENRNHPFANCRFDVYSYTTRVAMVNKNENGDWETFESMRAHPMSSFADATLVPVVHATL
jgi:hypothetical protein